MNLWNGFYLLPATKCKTATGCCGFALKLQSASYELRVILCRYHLLCNEEVPMEYLSIQCHKTSQTDVILPNRTMPKLPKRESYFALVFKTIIGLLIKNQEVIKLDRWCIAYYFNLFPICCNLSINLLISFVYCSYMIFIFFLQQFHFQRIKC